MTKLPNDLKFYVRLVAFKKALERLVAEGERRMLEYLEQGGKIDGFKLATRSSKRTWTEGAENSIQHQASDAGFSWDVLYKKELLSPAQIEKLGLDTKGLTTSESKTVLATDKARLREVFATEGAEFE